MRGSSPRMTELSHFPLRDLRVRTARTKRAYAHPTDSEIQHQSFALAAGAADHHLRVGRLLLLGEDRVAVLGRAGNHPLLARPADAELAGIVHVHAGIEQHLEDVLSLGDYEFLPRAGKLD